MEAISVGGGEVEAGHRIEDEDRALQAATTIDAAVFGGDVAPPKVDEEGLAGVVAAAVGADVVDVVGRQVALGEPSGCMRRDEGNAMIAHGTPLPRSACGRASRVGKGGPHLAPAPAH